MAGIFKASPALLLIVVQGISRSPISLDCSLSLSLSAKKRESRSSVLSRTKSFASLFALTAPPAFLLVAPLFLEAAFAVSASASLVERGSREQRMTGCERERERQEPR